jgi:RNA polymerase sigma-70 factor (ECF subfamily)
MHNGRFASTRHRAACAKDPDRRLVGHKPASEVVGVARADRDESFDWVTGLRASAADREEVIADLYALLLRGARFELARRRAWLGHIGRSEEADLATQAADDALVAILAKLDTFRGASRFTTWAYKFVLLEAGVKARRRAWHGREVTLDDEAWATIADAGSSAHEVLEHAELMRAIRDAMSTSLTSREREVFSARPEQRPDRRAGRTAQHDPWGPLHDLARRSAPTAPNARRRRSADRCGHDRTGSPRRARRKAHRQCARGDGRGACRPDLWIRSRQTTRGGWVT